jgi:hypothetical protein
MDGINLVSDATAREIQKLVGRRAAATPGGLVGPPRVGPTMLRVQSGAANDYGYPAYVQARDPATGEWVNLEATPTTVRVDDPNGGTFAENDYVQAWPAGVSEDGDVCFVVAVPGGGEVSLVETQSVTSPPSGYLDAKLVTFDPTTGNYVGGASIWFKNAGL